jgi:DNA-binding protein WhiA
MNFTSDVKRELISKKFQTDGEKKAALSAFIRTSGMVGWRDGAPSFFIVSETERVAEFFKTQFETLFKGLLTVSRVTMDKMSGRGKLLMEYTGQDTEHVLKELCLLGDITAAERFESENERIAYIKGAFLGGGSCVVPTQNRGGYHLEFVFQHIEDAEDFCMILEGSELLAKPLERSSSAIAYIKSKEMISDFLSIIGAENSLKKFTAIVEKRDESNRSNRAANCYAGNVDKSARAAATQILLFKRLESSGEMQKLDFALQETARTRLENPTLSLQELSQKMGVSKSCLNHRLRKLISLAEKIQTED